MSLKRAAGILYPIFSLPSRFGIGSLSQEAFDFVDFLKAAGQSAWQILPVGPTGFGNSPYQPLSAFAGNPYFISPEKLIEEGLLTWDECNAVDFGQNPEKVDYGKIYAGRRTLLRTAFAHFKEQGGLGSPAFVQYAKEQADWLDDYALFCALKEHFDGASWVDWEDAYRERDAKVLDMAALELQEEVNFYRFQQFLFDRQWTALHEYAAKNGIQIIGDIPFYVSLDSADAWSHPEVFRMTPQHIPEVEEVSLVDPPHGKVHGAVRCHPDRSFSRLLQLLCGALWGRDGGERNAGEGTRHGFLPGAPCGTRGGTDYRGGSRQCDGGEPEITGGYRLSGHEDSAVRVHKLEQCLPAVPPYQELCGLHRNA